MYACIFCSLVAPPRGRLQNPYVFSEGGVHFGGPYGLLALRFRTVRCNVSRRQLVFAGYTGARMGPQSGTWSALRRG